MSNDHKDLSNHRALTALATRIREMVAVRNVKWRELTAIADELDTLAHLTEKLGSSELEAPITDERMGNFFDALADSVEAMTDEELAEECREQGTTLEAEAARVKAAIAATVRKHHDTRVRVSATASTDDVSRAAGVGEPVDVAFYPVSDSHEQPGASVEASAPDALAGYRAALERLPVHVMPDLGQNPDTFPAAGEYVRVEDLRAALPVPALAPQETPQEAKAADEAFHALMTHEPEPEDDQTSPPRSQLKYRKANQASSDPRPRQAPLVERE
jgi:hypothetical protein